VVPFNWDGFVCLDEEHMHAEEFSSLSSDVPSEKSRTGTLELCDHVLVLCVILFE
jgi:hypothetical protein